MTERTLLEKIALAKNFHDGPLGASDHEFDPETPQGKWCMEVVEFFADALLDAHTAEQPHTGEIENAVSGDLPSVLGGSDSLARDGALIEQAKALLAINASGNAVPRVPNLAVEIIQRFIDTAEQPAPDAVAEAAKLILSQPKKADGPLAEAFFIACAYLEHDPCGGETTNEIIETFLKTLAGEND